MAEQAPTSTGQQLGSLAGGVLGGALTGGSPAGAMAGSAIGSTVGTLAEQYLSPAQVAQRREFKKARDRLRTGVGYGYSQAQKQQMQTEGNKAVANTLAAQQAELIRQQAGGMLGGGAVTQANRAMAQGAASAAAQTAAQVQAQSNLAAQQQYMMDQARIDAEAQRARELSALQGEQLKEPVSSLTQSPDNLSWMRKVAGSGTGGQPGTGG